MQKYDVVVLGAGPGGYVSAIRAAQLGASVAIVEKQYYGGTCLNVGCIPTKALVRNAEIIRDIQAGKSRGIKIDGELVLDYKKGKKAKDKACRQLVNGVVGLLAANGVKSYDGLGRVKSGKIVAVEGENGVEEIGYDKLIIATGSAPKKLPFEGIDLPGVLTSTELLELEEAPKRMVIVGGGVIGCEFATVFAAYGTELTIVEMLQQDGKLEGVAQLQRLMPLLGAFNNTSRLWLLKGHTPDELAQSRAATGGRIMSFAEAQAHRAKVGRNDPCPCGSGKKYKKCHGKNW